MPAEPGEEATPQRWNVERDQGGSKWAHPEPQDRQESKQSGDDEHEPQKAPQTARKLRIGPPHPAVNDENEPLPPSRLTVVVAVGHRAFLTAENDVGSVLGCLMLGHAVSECRQVDAGEHRFAAPEHDRRQREMELVNHAGTQILTDRIDATGDLHVATLGSELRLLQRRLDSVGHEDEGGATFHLDGIARMVRQYEGRRVVGRIVAPPALPALIRPRTANRPEHVAAKDEGTEAIHGAVCVRLIDAVRAAAATGHFPKEARAEQPLVQLVPALAERILQGLLRPCAETIERDRKASNAYPRHGTSTDCENGWLCANSSG